MMYDSQHNRIVIFYSMRNKNAKQEEDVKNCDVKFSEVAASCIPSNEYFNDSMEVKEARRCLVMRI